MRLAIALALLGAAASCSESPDGTPVDLPNGKAGIGFDDLRYSVPLHRVLAPAGRAGMLALVDPDTLAVKTVPGFSASDRYDGGHDFGATSVDEGRGMLFVTDRTAQTLDVVDPNTLAIVASVALAAGPDYVRYVAGTNEVWVTEPSAAQIEVFALSGAGPMTAATPIASVPLANGPESLVIDQGAGLAYTHRWQASSVVIDVHTRRTVAEWPNGCAASRGLAIDSARKFFFAGCLEGTLSVLDAAHGGRVLSSIARGAGYDVIGYSPARGHLYLAGTACSCLVVLGVSASGALSFLGRFAATGSTHCAASDDRGHAWVCDPDGGRLLRLDDPFPASW